MFSKLVAAFAFAALAAASTPAARTDSPQCCASIVSSSSGVASSVAALVGLDLSGLLDIPVGLSCSPITVLGNNCGGTEVVCEAPKEQWGSLIAINCIPITL